jgi:hypothetical protein
VTFHFHAAIDQGATTIDGVKFRTRAGMGQGGFCSARKFRKKYQHLQ